jgi:hypothetical protein
VLSEDSSVIPKRARRPRSQDYAFLQRRALHWVERLGHARWTDYNSHDPGITILDVLCYAITDLAYRARMPIEDVLAEPGERDASDALFSARKILCTGPVTTLDYRMLLIDCPGVDNAWLPHVSAPQPAFHLDCERAELTYDAKYQLRERELGILRDRKASEEVLAALSPLVGRRYPTRALLEGSLRGVLQPVDFSAWGELVSKLATRFETFPPQGVSDIVLELEADDALGDLALFQLELSVAAEEDRRAFEATLYIEPRWEAWLQLDPPAALEPAQAFDPVDWDPVARLYRSVLRVDGSSALPSAMPITLVSDSLRDLERQGFLSVDYAIRIDALLAEQLPSVWSAVRARILRIREIVGAVQSTAHAQRGMCEDYGSVRIVGSDEIGVCAQIELEPTADVARVAAEVQLRVGAFLRPRVIFHALEERIAAGLDSEAIFDGPALRHGFLDADEVARAQLVVAVHGSDLIRTIMEIPEVTAVRDLSMSRSRLGETLDSGQRWCLTTSGDRSLRWSVNASRLTFYKGRLPYRPDPARTAAALQELMRLQRHKRLAPGEYDLDVPRGRSRNLRNYVSVQNDFPLTYGIGRDGLPRSCSVERKAQALQLKAYLTLFDQLLADSSAQLAGVRGLLSLDESLPATMVGQPLYSLPANHRVTEAVIDTLRSSGMPAATLAIVRELQGLPRQGRAELAARLRLALGDADFAAWGDAVLAASARAAQITNDAPGVALLCKPFVDGVDGRTLDLDEPSSYEEAWREFRITDSARWLDQGPGTDPLREDLDRYRARRNRVLDHLLARFAESFTDYAAQLTEHFGSEAPERLLRDKVRFLRDYPRLSRERGRGFDRSLPQPWNSENVSGLERRVGRLLGFESVARRRLSRGYLDAFAFQGEPTPSLQARFELLDEDGEPVMKSSDLLPSLTAAEADAALLLGSHDDQARWTVSAQANGSFLVEIWDRVPSSAGARRLAVSSSAAATREDVAQVQDRARLALARAMRLREGMHLLEHVLLRPRATGDRLLAVCSEGTCDCCPGLVDPYSFRATAILPAVGRFLDFDFRGHVEDTLREEAPAHVHLKVCWVAPEALAPFEVAYLRWLTVQSDPAAEEHVVGAARELLIDALGALRSVYPAVHLHDCSTGSEQRPALLDRSMLGSQKDGDDA